MLLIFILKWNQNILKEQAPFDLQFFLFLRNLNKLNYFQDGRQQELSLQHCQH